METLELLEMAAKAAGIKHVDYEGVGYDGSSGLCIVGEHGQHLHGWNPLSDDADALRLAVKLGIGIEFYPDHDSVRAIILDNSGQATECSAEMDVHGTRYAIVRVAAEIGKAMP